MKVKAVFLDRDGVINEDGNYVHTIDDFHFIKNSIEAMKLMKDKGYALVIITNQSGIARGMYTEEDFLQLTEWMDWSLMDRGVNLDGVYFCPHHPVYGVGKYKVDCECRKPKIGLYLEAAKDCNIDLKGSYMVGDRKSDIEAGKNAGLAKNFLVRTGKPVTTEAESLADAVYDDLMAVAKALPNLKGKEIGQDQVIRKKVSSNETNSIKNNSKAEARVQKKPSNSKVYSKNNKEQPIKGAGSSKGNRFISRSKNEKNENQARPTADKFRTQKSTKPKTEANRTPSPWRTNVGGQDAGFAPLRRAVNKAQSLQETEEPEE